MSSSYTLPEDIKAAYLNTDYSFADGSRTIVIRLDDSNPDLLSYLELNHITSWAYMTAWNPYSNQQTDEYNRGQHKELLEKLANYKVSLGEGKGRDSQWPAEESVFVAGISRAEAGFLGRDFGQYAILVSMEDGKPELLPLPI